MTQAPESEFFTEDGKAVADRVYVEKGWGRKGFSIERLCNELGELHAQLDSLKASNEAQINEIRLAIARMMPDRAHLLPKRDAVTPSDKSPSPRDIFAEALEAELTRQRQPGGLLANDKAAWRPLTRADMIRATSDAHKAAMDQIRTGGNEARPTVKESLTADGNSLVERVAVAIDNAPYDADRHQWDEARAALRAVAGWLRDRGGYPWAWVAQVLEKEASRG